MGGDFLLWGGEVGGEIIRYDTKPPERVVFDFVYYNVVLRICHNFQKVHAQNVGVF